MTTKPELSSLLDDELHKMIARLAAKQAAKYPHHPLISANDLESEGILATLKAYENFDPANGTKFSTYAYVYIKHAMDQYCISNLFRLSASSTDLRNKLSDVQKANSGMVNIDDIDIAESRPLSDLNLDIEDYFFAGLSPRNKSMAIDRYVKNMKMSEMASKYEMSVSGIEQALKKLNGTLRRRGRRYESSDS